MFMATAESRILLYFSYLNEPKILEGALIPVDIAGTDTNQISHFRNHFWVCVFIRSSNMLFNALSGYESVLSQLGLQSCLPGTAVIIWRAAQRYRQTAGRLVCGSSADTHASLNVTFNWMSHH